MGADFTVQPLLNKSEARVFRELDRIVIDCNPAWQVMAQVSLGEILRSKDADAYGCINSNGSTCFSWTTTASPACDRISRHCTSSDYRRGSRCSQEGGATAGRHRLSRGGSRPHNSLRPQASGRETRRQADSGSIATQGMHVASRADLRLLRRYNWSYMVLTTETRPLGRQRRIPRWVHQAAEAAKDRNAGIERAAACCCFHLRMLSRTRNRSTPLHADCASIPQNEKPRPQGPGFSPIWLRG